MHDGASPAPPAPAATASDGGTTDPPVWVVPDFEVHDASAARMLTGTGADGGEAPGDTAS